MFNKLFKKNKEEEKKSMVGRQAELVHDATVFQYGTVLIDDKRYSAKTVDGSELCKGAIVKVVGENPSLLLVEAVK